MVVALVLGLGSCAFSGRDSEEVPAETEPRYQDAVEAMCEARSAEEEESSALFFDRAHGPLHVLADEVATEDRAATAALLEAKQEVEASLEAGSETAREDLDRLIDATVAALSVLDVEVETCA